MSGARATTLAALDSDRYLSLLGRLERLLDDPPLAGDAGGKVAPTLAAAVRRCRRRLGGALDRAMVLPPGPDRESALHEARKAAKRLRYVSEAAAGVLGKRGERRRERLKALQTVLGDHQDTVVSRPVLCELATESESVANSFVYGLMYGIEVARAERIDRDLTSGTRP
jgi:CHAD domain-containing protein